MKKLHFSVYKRPRDWEQVKIKAKLKTSHDVSLFAYVLPCNACDAKSLHLQIFRPVLNAYLTFNTDMNALVLN